MTTSNGQPEQREQRKIAVVGGGLGGLAAAVYAARAGHRVTLYDKARDPGGRAATQEKNGFLFNLGPHALYRGGPANAVLRELGVAFTGRSPAIDGAYAVRDGRKHALPGGFVSLLSTGLFGIAAKLETGRLMAQLPRLRTGELHSVSVRDWLDRRIANPEVRSLLRALIRLSTYANAPQQQSAGAALEQLQLATASGVIYVDGGWQALVDGLRDAAVAAGVEIVCGRRVDAVEHAGSVSGVRTADGDTRRFDTAIMACAPRDAAALAPDSAALRAWADAAAPVEATCLDVGLSRLPEPRALFALGIDRPLYFSVHSAAARLAPAGAATIQVAKYLAPDDNTDAREHEREMEALLDLVQPGWRDVVVERRFLPCMVAMHALPTASAGGLPGRPGPAVPDIEGLYVVGDWVGPKGMLLDAALASARQGAALAGAARAAA